MTPSPPDGAVSVLNGIFVFLVAGAVLFAAWQGNTHLLNEAWPESAKAAVNISIGLIGAMALWLGFMRILRDAGLMASLARALAPVMRRLFPEIPDGHPALSAMIMNITANMLGLGNAATPFGLKAMQELDRLNPIKGVSTNSMALFLAMNTSGVAVLPLGVIAIRASMESNNAGGIFFPSLLATICSTITAVLVAKMLEKRKAFAMENYANTEPEPEQEASLSDGIKGMDEAEEIASMRVPFDPIRSLVSGAIGAALLLFLARFVWNLPDLSFLDTFKTVIDAWLLPLLMASIVLLGFCKRVKVYESFIAGAREGFDIAVMIIPFLVAILVAVGLFRASGGLDTLTAWVAPMTSLIGFPAEALPMALIRPLSGSGAMGIMTETMSIHGPDSFVGFLVSVMNGSTETTFYVVALYFGSVRVRAARHTVAACLAADGVGIGAALFWSRLFF
ncbi:MAG: spore maturation protein [bacterium]|nr:spore maturation protein [bacterium]